MAKKHKGQVKTRKKHDLTPVRNDKGQIISGTANPNGRPLGRKNFYTDFLEAIKQIKDKNTGESLTETHIIKIGLEKMLSGNARFEGLYRDLMDRVYGKPRQNIGIDGGEDGKPIDYKDTTKDVDSMKPEEINDYLKRKLSGTKEQRGK